MSRKLKQYVGLMLCMACIIISLTGCGSNQADPAPTPTATMEPTVIPTTEAEATEVPATPTPEVTAEPTPEVVELTRQQKNAINMLNYLRTLTQEIRSSSNNRLYLEECYNSLLNNTEPTAVDQATMEEVMSLLGTLEKYRMIAVKRGRLQYIYEQYQADLIRDIVSNSIEYLSDVLSDASDSEPAEILAELAIAVKNIAVDAASSYFMSAAEIDYSYLQDGWELDDEEEAELNNSRKQLFSYMINMVNTFDLKGDLALSEDLVDEFVSWKNNENVIRRIQFFEANRKTYEAFGPYWLALAESYYENEEYDKCLSAVASYEALDMHIFRKDYDYAGILPLAIVSAEYTLNNAEYVVTADGYCGKILANTGNDDWALRFFVAQVYVDLYGKTKENAYLQQAYDIILNNVNYLVDEQQSINAAYLEDVVEQAAPKNETASAKKEREQYNKMLKEKRKTELPPLSEPLLLNCEFLFALADELNEPEAERNKIDRMLHINGEALFLSRPVDDLFWLGEHPSTVDQSAIEVSFSGSEFSIPAVYVTADTTISVTAVGGDEAYTYDEWRISKVERKTKGDVETYIATFKCDGTKYKDGQTITITVTPKPDIDTESFSFVFYAEQYGWRKKMRYNNEPKS